MRLISVLNAIGDLIDRECLKKNYASRIEITNNRLLVTIYSVNQTFYFSRTIPSEVLNEPNLKSINHAMEAVESRLKWLEKDIYPILKTISELRGMGIK